eukprot:2145710-Prymnesium_polylepis.1
MCRPHASRVARTRQKNGRLDIPCARHTERVRRGVSRCACGRGASADPTSRMGPGMSENCARCWREETNRELGVLWQLRLSPKWVIIRGCRDATLVPC